MPRVGNAPKRNFRYRHRRGKYHRYSLENVNVEVTDNKLVITIDLDEKPVDTVKTKRGEEDLIATTRGWKPIPSYPHMHVSVRVSKEVE